jgi:hypothetical protein
MSANEIVPLVATPNIYIYIHTNIGVFYIYVRERERVQLQQPCQSLPTTKHSTQNALQQNRVRTARILLFPFSVASFKKEYVVLNIVRKIGAPIFFSFSFFLHQPLTLTKLHPFSFFISKWLMFFLYFILLLLL